MYNPLTQYTMNAFLCYQIRQILVKYDSCNSVNYLCNFNFHRNENVFLSHENVPFNYHAALKVYSLIIVVCLLTVVLDFCSATSLEILRSTLPVQCLASKILLQ